MAAVHLIQMHMADQIEVALDQLVSAVPALPFGVVGTEHSPDRGAVTFAYDGDSFADRVDYIAATGEEL